MACPICQQESQSAFKPFCSRRCADHDLHRWLTQSYVINAKEDDDSTSADEDGQMGPASQQEGQPD